jgi:hypothetical protein
LSHVAGDTYDPSRDGAELLTGAPITNGTEAIAELIPEAS